MAILQIPVTVQLRDAPISEPKRGDTDGRGQAGRSLSFIRRHCPNSGEFGYGIGRFGGWAGVHCGFTNLPKVSRGLIQNSYQMKRET